MSTRMFRQVSLARLASPEQLDQILRVTTPKDWIGLLAAFGLVAVTIAWAYEGSIPTTSHGQGVVVRRGGVLNVVTRGAGLVLNLNVKVGDRIKANEVVARIGQPVLVEKMKAVREELEDAQKRRERAIHLRQDASRLQLEALDRQRANNNLRIAALEEQKRLTNEQIPVDEQLLARGLVTKQQVITTRQKLVSINNDIDAVRAQNKQLDAQAFNLQSAPQQEDEEMRLKIASLERQLTAVQQELSLVQNVVSPYGGEVLELRAYTGATVAAGEPVLTIQPDEDHLELLAYLPSADAKDVVNGMEVQISPTAVKREEFGFIKGAVTYVFNYPATRAAMMRHFENESLVQSLTARGPVTELRVALQRNPKTPSGFEWSTPRGAPITLSSGTICELRIVTRRQKPITLLVPYLKEKVGLS